MRRVLIGVLASFSLGAVGVAPAHAAALHFSRMASNHVLTDGTRFAFDVQGAVVYVRDTLTERLFQVASPQPDCRLGAVGSGLLLWICPASDPDGTYKVAHVIDLATRREVPFGAQDQLRNETLVRPPDGREPLWWVEIGRNWVSGEAATYYHGEHLFKLNWHTGQTGALDTGYGSTIDDLDAASGSRRLCTPIRATGTDEFGESAAETVGRWTIHQNATRRTTVLQRCGSAHAVRLRLADPFSHDYALTRRFAIWADDDGFLDVRDLRTGRVRSAQLPFAGPGVRLAATEGFVYVTGTSTTHGWRVKL